MHKFLYTHSVLNIFQVWKEMKQSTAIFCKIRLKFSFSHSTIFFVLTSRIHYFYLSMHLCWSAKFLWTIFFFSGFFYHIISILCSKLVGISYIRLLFFHYIQFLRNQVIFVVSNKIFLKNFYKTRCFLFETSFSNKMLVFFQLCSYTS